MVGVLVCGAQMCIRASRSTSATMHILKQCTWMLIQCLYGYGHNSSILCIASNKPKLCIDVWHKLYFCHVITAQKLLLRAVRGNGWQRMCFTFQLFYNIFLSSIFHLLQLMLMLVICVKLFLRWTCVSLFMNPGSLCTDRLANLPCTSLNFLTIGG